MKSLGADLVFDYNDRDAGAKIRDGTKNLLKYAWDTISIEESARTCAESLTTTSSLGPVYGTLLPVKSPRPDVTTISTVMYTVFGKDFQFGQQHMAANREDFKFGKSFFRLTEELLSQVS